MSLVAYGSSDDSEGSDLEDTNSVVIPQKVSAVDKNGTESIPKKTGSVSLQSDSGQSVSSLNNTGDIDNISDSDSEGGNDNENVNRDVNFKGNDETIDDMLKGLPTPKESVGGVIEETDELEDEVKPKPSQMADVPKPPVKKTKQPVRITIPALPDSDEDEPAKKKSRPATEMGGKKSGLFSLLPPPVHAPKKESNRILIPYSLSKKSKPLPTTSTTTLSSNITTLNATAKLQASLAHYSDSDEEEDNSEGPVNFFSLDSTLKSSQKQTTTAGRDFSTNSSIISEPNKSVPTVSLPPTMPRTFLNLPAPVKRDSGTTEKSDSGSPDESSAEADVLGKPDIDQDAPLTFKGGVSSQRAHLSGYPSSSSSAAASATDGMSSDQNIYYNMRYNETSQYPEVTDDQAFQHDEQFQRMQGKRQRGKEDINIMDVNADDYTNPADLMKNLTEEQTYQSHRKNKEDMPTSQQKRKHQIHYLAFQAKETEQELKNQWSNSRQTKRQTQAKYGF